MNRRLADATAADRVPFVDQAFTDRVRALTPRPVKPPSAVLRAGCSLSCEEALGIFRSQLESRHLDFRARLLKKDGQSFYTIGSAGHEGNAAVAAALRSSDPALLHYRSGAFFLQRARQHGLDSGVLDVLLGLCASSDEPIAGGRHKVFGSLPLSIPPQTSTIASQLPKSVGMAFALERAKRLGIPTHAPDDAIIACSFGDASANHSTATGAINAACWAAFQGAPMPILFVCEDNGIGISVPTPRDWIEASYSTRPGLAYVTGDGLDLCDTYEAAREAAAIVRNERRPAFLHLRLVRLLGHAGSDLETTYKTLDEIEAGESRDPLVRSAEILVEDGAATPEALCSLYETVRAEVAALAADAVKRPKLITRAQVLGPLAPLDATRIAEEVEHPIPTAARERFWGGRLPETERPAPLGGALNRALGELLVRYPEMILFGEDVGHKGGVYGVTRGLQRRAQRGRVFDTLLDEQTILGTAIGAAQIGLLPFPEIQYLAYFHNACDQIRGEAASLSFFSQGQYKNPMVVRIAGYAYQKGFGGHFHNDNAVAALRDIPGLVIASPSRGDDAHAMLQTCAAAAHSCGAVCIFLEPIALYPVRDLHEKGDDLWCTAHEAQPAHVPIGSGRVHGSGRDLLIVSWANGLYMSLRVAKRLAREHAIESRVLDLRWLAPLPIADLVREATAVGRVLLVDETRHSGAVSEALVAALVDAGFDGKLARVCSADSFIPLGDAANLVLVQEPDIEKAALELCKR
jgi:2-oxoisovalerate dehydrogenase E1 component